MKNKIVLLFSFLILANINTSFGQCCSAGNPSSMNINGAGAAGMLQANLNYIYSKSDTYYNGTEKLDKKYLTSGFDFYSLGLSYGLTDKLKLNFDIGFFQDKTQKFDATGYERKANGIGDMSLGLTYSTYKSKDKSFEVIQSGKITIPVGTVEQEYDGVILPIDLQPASGANKYNLGIAFVKSFGKSGFTLINMNSFEISQAIEIKNTSHKYGNLYNVSLACMYNITNELTGGLKARIENREKALTASKTSTTDVLKYSYINASGGTFVYLAPTVNYRFYDNWSFNCEVNIPVIKNVNGEQLTNSFFVSAGISTGINLLGSAKCETPEATSGEIRTETLQVNGACDMCKDRIEELVKEMKFVASCEWSADAKILTVNYTDEAPDMENIAKALADVGHDNAKYKAKDEVYNKLPACCKYRK